MSGKGDTPRPLAVDRATFEERWGRTFGKGAVEQVPGDVTLLNVIVWADRARMFIAMRHQLDAEAGEAVDAINSLERLARAGLSAPTTSQLRDALRNDPYCYAAYQFGKQEERDVR